MLRQLLAHELLVRSVAGRQTLRDRLLDRRVGDLLACALGALERDVRRRPHGRVEQHDPIHPLRMPRSELERQPSAEAVADDVGALDMERVQRVDQVVDVRAEAPRRLPVRHAVAA